MTQPARPDPARTPSRNDHVRPGPAPSGAVRPAGRAVGTLALHIGTRAQPGQRGRPAGLPLAGTARRHVRRLASAATWPRRPRHPVPGWAVVSAGLAPVLATGGWLVAEAVQPASYSPIRKTISVLAGHAGTDRWIMTGALFLVGGCQLVTAAGLAGVRCLPASCSPSRACPASASPHLPNPLAARLRSTSPGPRSARSHSRSGLPSWPGARHRGR